MKARKLVEKALTSLKSTRSSAKISGFLLLSAVLSGCEPGSSGGGIDPGVLEIPIAYIKRPIPTDAMGNPVQADLRDPRLFSEGGDVYLRTSSAAGGTVINVTRPVTLGTGDVKGLNVSHDGTKLIFSLRLFDPDPNNPPFPSWNIYEYDIENAELRRIIAQDLVAEEGDDLFPAYLPDGRIVFTSNRQRQTGAMQIAEGKTKFAALDEDEISPALVLHVMSPFGSNIHQISFNQSHDLGPQVLSGQYGGQIVFSRWDSAGANSEVNLYKSNPDGSGLEILYGSRSHATGTNNANLHFTGVRELSNGDLMVIAKPFSGTFDGGDILIIDKDRFVDIDNPIWSLNGLTGSGQSRATINNVVTDGTLSLDGRYNSAFPLRDGSNEILVSKSNCELDVNGQIRTCTDPWLTDPAAQEASPPYAIWLYDMDDDTQKPIVIFEPGMVITEAVAALPRARPPVIFDKVVGTGPGDLDAAWDAEKVGVINIRSVYDMGDTTFAGCFFNVCSSDPGPINSVQDFEDFANITADERPARFVRFTRAVGIPDPNDPDLVMPPDLADTAFGPLNRNRGMREILGYAPVEPDGSVKVKVPANVPLAIEVLDAEGRRIGPQHRNWLQVQAGDTLECVGCHNPNNGGQPPTPHGRADAEAPSINAGLQGINYPDSLIPGNPSPNPYYGNIGQTMAEVRFARVDDVQPVALPQPQISPDLIFGDYWTDPSVRAQDASYSYLYTDLDVTIPSPLNNAAFCVPWRFNCRVIINYPQQIHPIWQRDRGVDADMNMVGDDTCIECHTITDAMGNDRIAAGQLDLTNGPSDQEADHLKSYRELLFVDFEETLVGVNLVDLQVPDGMGGTTTVNVNPSMSANGARASYFIEKMTETELDAPRVLTPFDPDPALYVDHSGMLTGAELKLISEWLDIGAQYFNDPFDLAAPQN